MHSSECCHYVLFIEVKRGHALVHKYIYVCGNTESALTTESLDGYLLNLVGIRYS